MTYLKKFRDEMNEITITYIMRSHQRILFITNIVMMGSNNNTGTVS